ncbi:hypothetical protein [Burkholderia contaminans]|uniref:hypothetical protein n=1 Tax=Burkholderia contaminans TaxID=488447 RepID=UPI00163B101F|nr:hypothetical protein [Burkholderia contaminans]
MFDVDLHALPCIEFRVLDPSSFKLHPRIHERPEYDEHYDIDRDPLWSRTNRPVPFARIGYYQCDQIGTPQEGQRPISRCSARRLRFSSSGPTT